MHKVFLPFLVSFLVVLLPQREVLAASYDDSPSFYIGSGLLLNFPSGYRFAWKNIEFGSFSSQFGLCKIFPVDKYYAEFGFGLSGMPGLLVGVGYHNIIGYAMGFRADWSAFYSATSEVGTLVSIGITFNF